MGAWGGRRRGRCATAGLLVAALLLGVTAGGAAAEPGPGPGQDPAFADGTTAVPSDAAWQTYHSTVGGFTISVPAEWTASEAVDWDGVGVTTLGADTAGITIRAGGADADAGDLPNVLCQPVAGGGAAGTLCTDTLSRGWALTLDGPRARYRLVVSPRIAPDMLAAILASFQPDGGWGTVSPAPRPVPAPGLGDRCGAGGGPGKARPLCLSS